MPLKIKENVFLVWARVANTGDATHMPMMKEDCKSPMKNEGELASSVSSIKVVNSMPDKRMEYNTELLQHILYKTTTQLSLIVTICCPRNNSSVNKIHHIDA